MIPIPMCVQIVVAVAAIIAGKEILSDKKDKQLLAANYTHTKM